MRRPILLCLFMTLVTWTAFAQILPNRSFEEWDSLEAFDYPSDWNSGNADAYGFLGEVNVTESPDAFHEDASLRMETLMEGSDTLIGFVLLMGEVDEDSTGGLIFEGGVEISGKPDSLIGWFKHDIPAGDSAWVLILFEQADTTIGTNLHKISGMASTWTRYAFAIDSMPVAPDTVLVGFTSGNPDAAGEDGWLMVDSIAWVGITDTIPNYSFEEWETVEYVDPADWKSWNYLAASSGEAENAIRTSDAHSGDWAVELHDVFYEEPERNLSILTIGDFPGPEGFSGGMEWEEPVINASGWYKYDPAGPLDSGVVLIIPTKWDPVGDSTMYLGFSMKKLAEASSWTKFEFPVDYDTSLVPDTLNMVIAATGNALFSDSITSGGSILIIDDVWVGTQCNYTDTLNLFSQEDTTIDFPNTITLEAEEGEFWVSYLWSDGSTADTLLLDSIGEWPVTLEVTDSIGCEVWDSIHVDIVAVPGFGESIHSGLSVFPNPTDGMVNLKWEVIPEGEVKVSLLDINGKQLMGRVFVEGQEQKFDLGTISKGIYLMEVENQGRKRTWRISLSR